MLSHFQPVDVPGHDTHFIIDLMLRVMVSDFRMLGPPTFTDGAIYYALATILKPLGIRNDRGKSFTGAGIKGRLSGRPRRP